MIEREERERGRERDSLRERATERERERERESAGLGLSLSIFRLAAEAARHCVRCVLMGAPWCFFEQGTRTLRCLWVSQGPFSAANSQTPK